MQPIAATCSTCGAAVTQGQRFCERCGGPIAAAARVGNNCTACGAVTREGARFCPACGAPAGPPRCPACGAELRPGARFCGTCGSATGGPAPAAASASPPLAPGAAGRSLFGGRPAVRQVPPARPARAAKAVGPGNVARGLAVAAGGFALGLLGTFLDWITTSGASAGAFEDNAEYRIGNWLDTNDVPIDGIAVLAISAAGLAAAIGAIAGRLAPGPARTLISILGPALMTLGILQMQYITSEFKGSGYDVDWGIGLWLIVIGGVAAVASGFIRSGGRR